MKKTLGLCFSVLITNFLIAQQSVTISGPASVEVGVPYNYTFEFKPIYPWLNAVQADGYIITNWIVSTGTNGSTGSIPGYIGNPSNQSSYLNDGTYNNSNPKTIPIQWGNSTYMSSDKITVKLSGIYIKKSTGQHIGYFNFQPQAEQSVTVQRLINPIISGNTSILNCNQAPVTYLVSNATNGNSFQWEVTNGAEISGSSTATSVIVKPPLTGDFNVGCIVKRTAGNINYYVGSGNKITRTSRSVVWSTNPVNQTFLCKSSGLIFSIDNQTDIDNVFWNAPNCAISVETIVNGKRQVTITPNSSITTGSTLTVNAVVNFAGGCSVTTSSKTFNISDSTAPPIPDGYIEVEDWDCYSDSGLKLTFVPTTPFTNGSIRVYPPIMAHPTVPRNVNVTVTYTNSCTGATAREIYSLDTPTPCYEARLAPESEISEIIISPNPTNGNITIKLPEILSGNYQIFNQNQKLVQESKFYNQDELQIELSSKLKGGIYILKVITEKNVLTGKIILNN
ncbi:T9SS type A sorting domain-containing protein [Flavobacterium sp. LS1R47]|uniref:T9SS type A sorting domain-containing protein n=1 Tax=Flavobacterium frigoritolerans TaxID=2987686 RepID=A0A9X2Z0L8_9FLAO|nr:T9SS type A sorting domain-containing protein [Flavobacterium frigoritolerans]MCV9933648.1 T9SS type A sorting domain-containing protein [Flavobacterium frigoritolerans]